MRRRAGGGCAGRSRRRRRGADEEAGDLVDRLLRRRQADAHERPPTRPSRRASESARWLPRLFDASAWISSTMTVRVVASIVAARFRAEQHVQRLGRRHHDVRRPRGACSPARAAACRRCAPACGCRRRRSPRAASSLADAGERHLEVLPDVVRQRLQRRHVDDRPSRRRGPRASPSRPARRWRPGRRRASCPNRSARRSARCAARGSAARRGPAPASAPETCRRTRRRRPGETSGAMGYFLISRQSGNRLAASAINPVA